MQSIQITRKWISFLFAEFFSEKHDPNHKPSIHKGVVIKLNANQRYATTAITALVLKEIAAKNNIPIQVHL